MESSLKQAEAASHLCTPFPLALTKPSLDDSFESVNRAGPPSANRSLAFGKPPSTFAAKAAGTRNDSLMESRAEIEPNELKVEPKTRRLVVNGLQKQSSNKSVGKRQVSKVIPNAKRINKSVSTAPKRKTPTEENPKRTQRLFIDCGAETLKESQALGENINEVNTTSPSKRASETEPNSGLSIRSNNKAVIPFNDSFSTFRGVGNERIMTEECEVEAGFAQPMLAGTSLDDPAVKLVPKNGSGDTIVQKQAKEVEGELRIEQNVSDEEFLEILWSNELSAVRAEAKQTGQMEDLPAGTIRKLLDSEKVTRETTLYALAGVFSLCAGLKSIHIVCKEMEDVTYNVISINQERVENIERELQEVQRHIKEGLLSVKTIQFIANCLQNYGKVVDPEMEEETERLIVNYLRCVIEFFFNCDPRVEALTPKPEKAAAKSPEQKRARSVTPTKKAAQRGKLPQKSKAQLQTTARKEKKGTPMRGRQKKGANEGGCAISDASQRSINLNEIGKPLPHSPSFGMPLNFVEVPSEKLSRSTTPVAKGEMTPRKNLHRNNEKVHRSTFEISREQKQSEVSTPSGLSRSNRSLSFTNLKQSEAPPQRSLSPKPKNVINLKAVPNEKAATKAIEERRNSASIDTQTIVLFLRHRPNSLLQQKVKKETKAAVKAERSAKSPTPMKKKKKMERSTLPPKKLDVYFDDFQDYFNKKLNVLNTIVRSSQSITERVRERLALI